MSTPFIGEIRMFAGSFAPRSWALCDGQTLLITQNGALFSLFGTMYGGDGRTTFSLPDIRGRVPLHKGQGPGLSNRVQGAKLGSETESTIGSFMPVHSHTMQGSSNFGSDTTTADNVPATGSGVNLYNNGASTTEVSMDSSNVSATGANQPHNNMMPFQCVNFIVALSGIFPSRN